MLGCRGEVSGELGLIDVEILSRTTSMTEKEKGNELGMYLRA